MNRRLLIIIAIVVLIVGGFAYYKSSKQTFEAGEELTDSQVEAILAAVGKHIKLPTDETPLVATVADIELLLEREPFYTGAENGDILLLYPNAGKAILYAPDEDLIVNVGPIILDQNAQGDTAAPAATVPTADEGGDAGADDIPDETQ
jgi:hypothetical protein